MYQMVLLVLNNVELCMPVLDAWEGIGVTGVTILESTGLGRMRQINRQDDLPLMPSIWNMLRHREEHHRTLFTVVDNDNMVESLITATLEVVGSLDDAHSGVLFVLPVSRAIGLSKPPVTSPKAP